ncbi:MAG: CPBP family intramembrane metalloprotease [Gammaproteobacteria bacterium]|nr:CPBP family intramembrane metalloprotease [Gammaproteobacteria bacterium]MBU1625631.1 CPBP family intramembrane metalloprotease [Gammaproteobacteria bacterium]MBU1980891.1 CPBP family intramembrane metalloprotease [Gammaproteobacteria bacterium]
MIIERYRHPFLFYGLATAIPWALWFAAAYLSHLSPSNESLATAVGVLGVVGLLAPAFIAFWMIWPDRDLRSDIKRRLVNLKGVQPIYLFLACFLMLGSILLAQAISLLFGHSADQFSFAGQSSFSAGIFPGWFLLFLAPLVEELAWHSYGTDCLRVRMNLIKASLVFAVFWAFWHMPLSFIKDYYHSNVAETGLLYSLNFAFSLIPFVILMNWLYYKTNRNILVVVVFHITAGCFNELFATHPDSKVIQTILLSILALYLVIKDRDFFLQRSYREDTL